MYQAHVDAKYVYLRNKLIDQAAAIADQTYHVGANPSENSPVARQWNRKFLKTMDALAEEHGLCIPFRKMVGK